MSPAAVGRLSATVQLRHTLCIAVSAGCVLTQKMCCRWTLPRASLSNTLILIRYFLYRCWPAFDEVAWPGAALTASVHIVAFHCDTCRSFCRLLCPALDTCTAPLNPFVVLPMCLFLLQIVRNTLVNETYVLYQCGLQPPPTASLPEGSKLFSVPLDSTAVIETVPLAFLVSRQ